MSESRKSVLIVDDEASIRQSFTDYFEDRLWRTSWAESGEQALEILEKESPDATIVDIRLGGMDGDTFIREACRNNFKMVFVICTGSPEYIIPADLQKMNGVSHHLFRKPVTDMDEIEKELLRSIQNIDMD